MSFIKTDLTHSSFEHSTQERALQTSLRKADAMIASSYQSLPEAAEGFDFRSLKTWSSNTANALTSSQGSIVEPNDQSHSTLSSLVQSVMANTEQQQRQNPTYNQQKTVGSQPGPDDKFDPRSAAHTLPDEQPLTASDVEPHRLSYIDEDPIVPSDAPLSWLPSIGSAPADLNEPSTKVEATDRSASQAVDDSTGTETASTPLLSDGDSKKKKQGSLLKATGKGDAPLPSTVDSKVDPTGDTTKVVGREHLGELALRGTAVQGNQVTTEATAAAVQRLISQLNSHLSQSWLQPSMTQQTMHQLRISLPNQLSSESTGEVLLQIQGRDLKMTIRGASDEAKSLILPRLGELQIRPGLRDFQLQVSWSHMGPTSSWTETAQTRSASNAGSAAYSLLDDERKHKKPYEDEEGSDED